VWWLRVWGRRGEGVRFHISDCSGASPIFVSLPCFDIIGGRGDEGALDLLEVALAHADLA
jgi:hypothetical protein